MDSTVKQSLLWRSKLNHVDMFKSRVKRAVLTDCEVSECVVIGTEFKGMRLRFGVWKHGRLVGRVGEGEVVFEEMDVSPLYLWSVGGERGGGGGLGVGYMLMLICGSRARRTRLLRLPPMQRWRSLTTRFYRMRASRRRRMSPLQVMRRRSGRRPMRLDLLVMIMPDDI